MLFSHSTENVPIKILKDHPILWIERELLSLDIIYFYIMLLYFN